MYAQNTFVDGLQLRHGELLVQQSKAHRLEVHITAQAIQRHSKDAVVVKRKSRHIIYGEPANPRGIIAGQKIILRLANQSIAKISAMVPPWLARPPFHGMKISVNPCQLPR